jgi:hypothetical protein
MSSHLLLTARNDLPPKPLGHLANILLLRPELLGWVAPLAAPRPVDRRPLNDGDSHIIANLQRTLKPTHVFFDGID